MESASPLNAQQIEYWNGAVGDKWARLQERIDLHMNAITDAVIPFAAPQLDERVLDIGCGCGTTTLLLAMKVGAEGATAGVDISTPMLNVARARAQAQNANIAFVEADASVHDFQPVFDLVFSRFGVMFFADPTAAFTNIRGSVAPRGRLAFVCWRSAKENLWASVPMMAAKDLLPPQEPADPYAPGPFAFAEKDRLHGILANAGFHGIRIEPLDTTMNMGKTLDDAAEESLNIGPLARAAAEADAATRANIYDAVKKAYERFLTPAGITPPAACWLVRARG